MDSALTASTEQPGRSTALPALPVRQILALLAGAAALAVIVVAALGWVREPDYKVLFANLSDRDGGAVVAALSQMNVPYRFAEAGGAILVPASAVHEARLKLASQGLPKGGTVGFELMETQRFGITQFQERLNFQRGLEGELTRSIQALAAVQAARVHLALPTQNGFLRAQQKPSASVLLSLHPGRSLDRAQVAGIVHLVASSVPELNPAAVSVVDQSGSLLSSNAALSPGTLDSGQIGYLRQLEATYAQRIVDILSPIVGLENVRAQVTADVDFAQVESTAEQFRPNQGSEPAAVRSQQVSETSDPVGAGTAGAARGIPGALSNQPAAPAIAPLNAPRTPPPAAAPAAVPGQAAANGAAGAAPAPPLPAAPAATRRDAVTNYEVDRTVRVTRNPSGSVRRLSAAVVVNHRRSADGDGKAALAALTAAEMESINALVREAIGFSADRGDSINVVNAPFSEEVQAAPPELPFWQAPATIELARASGKHLLLLVLALVVVFAVIRPAARSLAGGGARRAPRLQATVDEEIALPSPAGAAMPVAPLPRDPEAVLRLARENPATVANVVRNWVSNER
jgi:flagellar M-ring protein FliF